MRHCADGRVRRAVALSAHQRSRYKERNVARYSKASGRKVERAMHERKHGTLRSGSSGKKVTSRKQAIAIGLSEARRDGAHVPKKKSSKKSSKGPAAKRSTAKRSRTRSA